MGLDAVSDLLPVNWCQMLKQGVTQVPVDFALDLMEKILEIEDSSEGWQAISLIELTLWLAVKKKIKFPFWNSVFSQWELSDSHDRLTRPTLAYLIKMVRRACVEIFSLLNLDSFYRRGLLCPAAVSPQDGLIVRVPSSFQQLTMGLLNQFAVSGHIRKAADLAKPIPFV